MAKTGSLIDSSALATQIGPVPVRYGGLDIEEVGQMPHGELQDIAVDHLRPVLKQLFHAQQWYIPQDLLIGHPEIDTVHPLAPDLAVFVGVTRGPDTPALTSWVIHLPESPPPTVVFEVASNSTWRRDVDEKPPDYATIGVAEYYAFDSRPESVGRRPPLRGWKCQDGRHVEIEPDERGRLWSSALGSWLAADGRYLRLQDADGNVRRTGEEAERDAKDQALAAKEQALAAKEQALAAKDHALAAKEQERAAKERAWAKLRELGIDPEGSDWP